MAKAEQIVAALVAIEKAIGLAQTVAEEIRRTRALVAEARAVATANDQAEIDAALARLQARNDVELPEAIAALRAQ